MLKHKKVAVGDDDGNPDHVQAGNWNEGHVYPVGAIWPVAKVDVTIIVAGSVTIDYVGSARVTSCSAGTVHPIDLVIDQGDVNIMSESGYVEFSGKVSMSGPVPVGHIVYCGIFAETGGVFVGLIEPASNIDHAQFPATTALTVELWAEAVAAP
jgi:hypothetical protein